MCYKTRVSCQRVAGDQGLSQTSPLIRGLLLHSPRAPRLQALAALHLYGYLHGTLHETA